MAVRHPCIGLIGWCEGKELDEFTEVKRSVRSEEELLHIMQ